MLCYMKYVQNMLYNMCRVMLYNICYKTNVVLCYMTYVKNMLYNMCHVMLYNMRHCMLYNICPVMLYISHVMLYEISSKHVI